MVKSVKLWKSYEAQFEKLRDHNLNIDLPDEEVKNYLERIRYYRLSGYAYPFRCINKNADKKARNKRLSAFQQGSLFSDSLKLYRFDCNLRLLAVEAIELIEPAAQTRIAYRLGKYDAFAHEKQEFWQADYKKTSRLGQLSPYLQ